jgi:methionyl-tRNA formyltransferase
VIAARETPIGGTETAPELEHRLAEMGVDAVLEAIDLLVAAGPRATPGVPQDPARVTRAPRLAKADGIVDWSLPAARSARMRRALEPWPRTATFLHAGAERPPVRVVLEDVAVVDGSAADRAADPAVAPGSILSADDAGLVVACGENTRLVVRRLVPEGKRSMSAAEFARGHALFSTARFG